MHRLAPGLLAVCSGSCATEHVRPRPTPNAAEPAVAAGRAQAELAVSAWRAQLVLNQLHGVAAEATTPDSLRVPGLGAMLVPDFELLAADATPYSSKTLVGKQPFAAVFFATWCTYCEGELKSLQLAFQQLGPLPVIPVSVDPLATWSKVPGYLASFGIDAPAVRATDYPGFAVAYNPADILPAVAIVDGRGALVDYLHGYDPAHAERLVHSLRVAMAAGPLKAPELDTCHVDP